jgi:hypothetical protein
MLELSGLCSDQVDFVKHGEYIDERKMDKFKKLHRELGGAHPDYL